MPRLADNPRSRPRLVLAALALLAAVTLGGCAVDEQILGSWTMTRASGAFELAAEDADGAYTEGVGLVFATGGQATLLLGDGTPGETVLKYTTRDGHLKITLGDEVWLDGDYWFNNRALIIQLAGSGTQLFLFPSES
jgi:hypothetical protein